MLISAVISDVCISDLHKIDVPVQFLEFTVDGDRQKPPPSSLVRYWGCCCIRWLIIRCGRRRWGYWLVSWWVWYRGLVVGARCDRREECGIDGFGRSEEHTSELQSLMRISYAVF